MRIRTFRIDLGKNVFHLAPEIASAAGHGFCVLGSRVFQEIWVADFAYCWSSVLACECGEWSRASLLVPILGTSAIRAEVAAGYNAARI